MKKRKKVYIKELQQDIKKEKTLLPKELFVIAVIVVLSMIREVYLHV